MVQRGNSQELEVTFSVPDGTATDPDEDTISLVLTLDGDDVLTVDPDDIVRESTGRYHYIWEVPALAALGTYVAVWAATLPGDLQPTYTYQSVDVVAVPDLPGFSGCDWPVDPACFTEAWEAYSDEVQERAVHLASATLYRLCGYRVGGCPLTVRPSAQNAPCGSVDAQFMGSLGVSFSPLNWNGQWANVGHVGLDARLVDLPVPIGEIIEVKVDGEVLDEADYTIVDNRYLAWTGDGDAPWPLEQDWVLPDTEVGTFSVTYLNAYPVDALGAYAAGLLAMEFAKACAGGGKACRLPSNVISIVRQGVSYEMAAGAFPDGKTNIREVDAYIEQWNPKGRRSAGMIFNPGRPKVHVQR